MPVDLEQQLDHLYGVDLDQFVAERSRLASALRKEGRREDADRIKALRKPSLSAWVVNRLARTERSDMKLLLDAGDRLAAAQRSLLSGGDKAAFEQAADAERQAVDGLSRAASELLGPRGSPATLDRVAATLRAAAVSGSARDDLRRGRLTGDVDFTGFDVFSADPGIPTIGTASRRPVSVAEERRSARERGRVSDGKESEGDAVVMRNAAERDAAAAAEREAAARRELIERLEAEVSSAAKQEQSAAGTLHEAELAEDAAQAAHRQTQDVVDRSRADHVAATAALAAARAKLDDALRAP